MVCVEEQARLGVDAGDKTELIVHIAPVVRIAHVEVHGSVVLESATELVDQVHLEGDR